SAHFRAIGFDPRCGIEPALLGEKRSRKTATLIPTRYMTESRPDFELQPTLAGKLIELRPLTPVDFDALFSAASDPLIWEQHPESDRYTRKVFQRYFDSAIESGGAFAIIDRKSDRIIGSSRYCNLKPT